ncbi:MAG: hypothetical protein J0I76_14815 [Thiobacillus sp.]|nr:hypothetical protein [Thiobacillus sp.]
MSAVLTRLPDDTAERLKSRAQALAAWDTENRFRTLAVQGDVQQALAILDRLDAGGK